jgi:uncharacterized protein (TIGR03435 family)
MRYVAFVLTGCLAVSGAVRAQALVAFEVASVKPNVSSDLNAFIQFQKGGRVIVRNIPLHTILLWAYQLHPPNDGRLIGAPAWTRQEKFDIDGKAPDAVAIDRGIDPVGPPSPGLLMLRTLLAERFGLVIRTETRDLPVQALHTLNADGRLGPKLVRSDMDCERIRAERLAGAPVVPPAPGIPAPCTRMQFLNRIAFQDQPIAALTNFLSPRMQRVVVDRTGLTGLFDLDMTWTPDEPRPAGSPDRLTIGGVDIDLTGGAPADPSGPALLTALREQLGLRLESSRAPVEVYVVERVERPTPN